MSGTSNVGGASVYEAGDQRNVKKSELKDADRYNEGQPHSHKPNDSKDERSIANRLAREEKAWTASTGLCAELTNQYRSAKQNQASHHGNQPSKGAKIDAEIQAEEEEILKKKGGWGSKQQ